MQVTQEEINELYKPTYFWNHGDNPAYKRLSEIMVENAMEGKQIDHRTYVVNNFKR